MYAMDGSEESPERSISRDTSNSGSESEEGSSEISWADVRTSSEDEEPSSRLSTIAEKTESSSSLEFVPFLSKVREWISKDVSRGLSPECPLERSLCQTPPPTVDTGMVSEILPGSSPKLSHHRLCYSFTEDQEQERRELLGLLSRRVHGYIQEADGSMATTDSTWRYLMILRMISYLQGDQESPMAICSGCWIGTQYLCQSKEDLSILCQLQWLLLPTEVWRDCIVCGKVTSGVLYSEDFQK